MTRGVRLVVSMIVCLLATARSAPAQPPPDAGWVVLPVDEYRTLRQTAEPRLATSSPAVDAALSRVEYDLRVDGETATGTVLLTADVLRDGNTLVRIPDGLLVREARPGTEAATLIAGTPAYLMLRRAGRHVVSLTIAIPIKTDKTTSSLTIPESFAPVSRASIVVPRGGLELVLDGGFIAERVESAPESRWTAYGVPKRNLVFHWRAKADTRRAELPLRTRATITSYVGLGEETAQLNAAIRLDVMQGLARDLTVALPPGLTVNQVDGTSVADWESSNEALRIRFSDGVSSSAQLTIAGEQRSPRDGTIAIPIVRIPAAERESGGVAVDVIGAGEIAERQARGFEPADASELGAVGSGRESPSMVAFRLHPAAGHEPRSLTVGVVRYTPQSVLLANVEEARYRVLATDTGRLLVEARYAVRNNQRGFLKVTLPAHAALWSAMVAGRPVRPGAAETGALLLPLEKSRAGAEGPTFLVELVYLQDGAAWSDEGRSRIDLPAIDLPASRSGLTIHYPPGFRVIPEPGAFRPDVDNGAFTTTLSGNVSNGASGVAIDYSSASSGISGGVVAGITGNARTQASKGAPAAPSSGGLQALVDRFKTDGGPRSVVGALPVHVAFPPFGPAIFLASELTAESQAPFVDLTFKKDAAARARR